MYKVEIGGATVSVRHDYGLNWEWRVKLADGTEFADHDFRQGAMASVTDKDMMGTLLSFMGACAESIAYSLRTGDKGENVDLFPEGLHEWIDANSDEIGMIAYELEYPEGE